MALPQVEEIGRGLSAALRMMTDGARAAPRIRADWRDISASFWAILLTFPAAICLIAANNAPSGLPLAQGLAANPTLLPLTLLQHAAPFILAPLLVLALTRTHAPKRFASFLIGWNWAEILVTLMMAVPALLLALKLSTPGLAFLQTLAIVALAARLRFAMIRATLSAPPAYAGLMVSIFMLGELVIARLVGSPLI